MQSMYYETDSFLHRLNPLSKVIAAIPLFIALNLITDIWVMLACLLLQGVMLVVLGQIPFLRLVRTIAPLLLVLLGFLILYPLFVGEEAVVGSPVLFWIGGLPVRLAGVLFGLETVVRILALLMTTLPFVLTSDPGDFVRAMVQQWKVHYRLGYTALAAYRFIPILENDLRLIRAAHKVRGISQGGGLRAFYVQLRRMALPLLASGIRSAERKALAMDARAFGAFATRTYYRRFTFTLRDWLFIAVYWLVNSGVIGCVLWRGVPGVGL